MSFTNSSRYGQPFQAMLNTSTFSSSSNVNKSVDNTSFSRYTSPGSKGVSFSNKDLNPSSNRTNISMDNSSHYSVSTPNRSCFLSDTEYATHSATSVVSAFRELQVKAKSIETERAEAIRDRDELRQELHERRREQISWVGKAEMQAADALSNIRAATERTKREYTDLDSKLAAHEEMHRSIQRGLIAQKSLCTTLEDDIGYMTTKIHAMERNNAMLKSEIFRVDNRTNRVREEAELSPSKNRAKRASVLATIASLEAQISRVKAGQGKSEAKASALQQYMELVIRINEDLCDTIVAQEQSKARIMRFAGKYQPPPHHQWPKEVPFNNIMDAVATAATVTAAATVERTARKASKTAVKTLMRALSPGRSLNRSPSSPSRRTRSSSTGRRATAAATSSSSMHTRGRRSSSNSHDTRSSSADRSRANLNSNSISSRRKKSTKYDAYDENHSAADMSSSRWAPSHTLSSHYPYDGSSHMDSAAADRSSYSHRTVRDTAMNTSSSSAAGRSHRYAMNKQAIVRDGAITYATRLAAASAAAAAASLVEPTRRVSSAPGTRRAAAAAAGVSSASTRTKVTKKKKKKATTASTSTGRTVHIVRVPPRSAYSDSDDTYSSDDGDDDDSSTNSDNSSNNHNNVNGKLYNTKPAFIPSGTQHPLGGDSHEFNVIASVSKASRAAKDLNATIAAKAKSLLNDGKGEGIYGDSFPHINLTDFQGSLAAVKKMNSRTP